MPKLKTRRAAAKRFSTTGTGKIKRMKPYKSHILESKSPKRKRNLRKRSEEHTSELQWLLRQQLMLFVRCARTSNRYVAYFKVIELEEIHNG